MGTKLIRIADINDTESILSIYAPYVTNTTITFEYDMPPLDEVRKRIKNTLEEYPYIVYINDDKIVGYAYAHRLRERVAYQWDAELSVYVDTTCHHQGIGRALYTCLMELLKLQNVVNVYGVVTIPNPASEKLHEQFGFRLSGVLRNTGFKHGRWLDVAWYEKTITEIPADPHPFLPFPKVDKEMIENVLTKYSHSVQLQ